MLINLLYNILKILTLMKQIMNLSENIIDSLLYKISSSKLSSKLYIISLK